MDKKTILAFVLIGLILILTQSRWYKEWVLGIKHIQPNNQQSEALSPAIEKDSLQIKAPIAGEQIEKKEAQDVEETLKEDEKIPIFSQIQASQVGKDIHIETDNYLAVISTKGATIKSWLLKKYFYDKKEKSFVQLIKDDGYGNLGITIPFDEDTLFTHNYIFTADQEKINFSETDSSKRIVFELDMGNNKIIRKTYVFYKDKYSFDLNIELLNLGDLISNRKYSIVWLSGLHHTEKDYLEDIRNTKAYIFTGGSKVELKLPEKPNEKDRRTNIEGKIDWVALRTKYFASVILPKTNSDINANIFGETLSGEGKKVIKNYAAKLNMKISEAELNNYSQNFQIFIGPLDYSIIKQYHSGFDQIMGYGPGIIRPFAKLTLTVFKFLYSIIPNYGFVLIVFSILVKIVVYPLTRKSYVSMREMQKLQPLMIELKEKYGNDPQRLNKETMKLYKEHGVNPLSGCIPTLLQMPLLWAIFLVFRNTIQLRQAPFVWWINDLSAPDTILLPFSLPLIGNALHIIPLIMGATMFFQQKMTMQDPKQKAMVYFMPIFLTFIFYSFPSGLNLYYTLFNIFSLIQQKITPEKHEDDSAPQQFGTDNKMKNKKSLRKK